MTTPAPRAFGCAALLGLVAALPGFGYVVVHVTDTVAHGAAGHVSDLFVLVGIAAIGPGLVLASAARMMRRADRPIALFVVSLLLTSAPTLLFMGLATFGPDGGGLVVACMFALLCAALAIVIAIVAAIRQRVAS